MPYTADISRRNPTAFLFVIDQSGSMSEAWVGEQTRARAVSDALNKLLAGTIAVCSKDEGVRHYFDVGVIGYGGRGVVDALPGEGPALLRPIPRLEAQPLRVETRAIKIPDGGGGILETQARFPVWFDPESSGGTPMVAALTRAAHEIGTWCDAHPDAFPPTVLHITDGESSDGDPEPTADILRQLSTRDGQVLLFNLHISGAVGAKVLFPDDEAQAPHADARRLFRMSSLLPPSMATAARQRGYAVGSRPRGYGYNADFVDLVGFFELGTRPANLER